eukprot:CAMPEP_0119301922 /NCGR_PEP_ID=MMETSP1333-20130426/3618_1 /TAXON_ID=418940 /ORGANISM="Scyphosphaera apsteinii, Strain RCC1455" /LENGTH=541 /DNA_ID=CAMNT_0007304133 /DNA_START=13 /DNA_END=1638 /DNA_ORIENTATION=-
MTVEWIAEDDVEHYTWVVVLGFLAAFMAAFGIGANDVANAFATSVGSQALTVKQACAIAVVMEFIGATFLGGEVVKTIRKGIADEDAFDNNPPLLMFGCLCAITAVFIWLLVASRLEMPVSTTHSCVGGMIGMAIAARGSGAVVFYKDPNPPDKPLPGGFVGVILSWFISPVLSGFFASILFFFVRLVLRSKAPFENSVKIYPVLVFACITIITLFMLMKGIKSAQAVKDMEIDIKVAISFGIGILVALLFIPAYMLCKKRIVTGQFVAPPLAIEKAEERAKRAVGDTESGKATATRTCTDDVEVNGEKVNLSRAQRLKNSMLSSMNTDIHAAVENDEATLAVHKNAERFDKQAEAMFTYLQVFSACFDALAHGANDVANAVGPFATIYLLYDGNKLGSKQDMGDNKYWICGLGGIGIGVGLLLYGSQILRAIGVKLAVITPSRGFCIEMGSSTVVILGAYYGLPLSTTHCQVGATIGVALLEGARGFNKMVMAKTAFGWVFTCVFVGFVSAMIFSFGAYAPMARLPECKAVNDVTSGDLI